jgi:hypothetical protein
MSRSPKDVGARPRAVRQGPDAKVEIRRFITNLDRLAGGPLAPPLGRAAAAAAADPPHPIAAKDKT